MINDVDKIVLDIKEIVNYLKISPLQLINVEVLYAYQANFYDRSIVEKEIIKNLELVTKYGNLDGDLHKLQEIELIKQRLYANFQKIDKQLMEIVSKIHKLKHEAFLLNRKKAGLKKIHLKSINKKISQLDKKITMLIDLEKDCFESAFINQKEDINELISKYVVIDNDINDTNDMRIIENVRNEIKFFDSGNFYNQLLEQVDINVNSLEIGHLINPIERLDSFIFYTKGIIIALRPKLKKLTETLTLIYNKCPEYKGLKCDELAKKYNERLIILNKISYIIDNLSYIKNKMNQDRYFRNMVKNIENAS